MSIRTSKMKHYVELASAVNPYQIDFLELKYLNQ